MAENARPPVAVRIVRPYETEEAFLESELETVGKTSVILIGAHSRPNGVILRFEVTLANGAVILRGEGRVLAFKDNAFRGQPGLALRFTRLDPKSKALVDRAAALRDARLSGDRVPAPTPSSELLPDSVPSPSVRPPPSSIAPARAASVKPSPVRASARPDPVIVEALTAPTPAPPETSTKKGRPSRAPNQGKSQRPPNVAPSQRPPNVAPSQRPPSVAPSAGPAPEPEAVAAPPPPPSPVAESVQAAVVNVAKLVASPPNTPEPIAPSPEPEPERLAATTAVDGTARKVEPPADRDGLLARLRARAAGLSPEKKAGILRSS